MSGLDHLSWRDLMDAVNQKAGTPIAGFVVIAVLDGQTVRYGADYSRDAKVRAVLERHLKSCLREVRKLGSDDFSMTGYPIV